MQQPPIFVNGFSRGGTTILMNLLASHPEVCTVGEIHQLFKGSSVLDSATEILRKAVFRDLPVILATGEDVFSPRKWQPRRQLGYFAQYLIRHVLRQALRGSVHDHLNRFKFAGTEYQTSEIANSRLLGKNLDGTTFLTDTFREIYPRANFVGIVRNGLAVCEGHVRRGRKAGDVGRLYRVVGEKILQDQASIPDYQLVHFEKLITNPLPQLQQIFRRLGLDPLEVKQVRQQARKTMNDQGEHRLNGVSEWEVCWLDFQELRASFDPQINDRQIRLLSQEIARIFLRRREP